MNVTPLATVSFDALARHEADPCVSIIVPVDLRHPDGRASHLLVKQLVADARAKLATSGVKGIDDLLAPTDEVLQRPVVVEHGGGLGLFLSPGFAAEFVIDGSVQPLAAIGTCFTIGPLVPSVAHAPVCHVLTVGAENVDLYRIDGQRWSPCDVPDLPRSIDETLWYEREERKTGSHAGGPIAGGGLSIIGHGSGAQDEDRKERLTRFFQKVDDAVVHHVRNDPDAPLVVAGTTTTVSRYQQITRHRRVIAAPVGSPEEVTSRELRLHVNELLEPVLAESHEVILERLAVRLGTGLAGCELDELDVAAAEGRVSDLLISSTQPRWAGSTSPIEWLEDWRVGATDIVNRVIGDSWRHGARMHCVTPGRLPNESPLAALYRY